MEHDDDGTRRAKARNRMSQEGTARKTETPSLPINPPRGLETFRSPQRSSLGCYYVRLPGRSAPSPQMAAALRGVAGVPKLAPANKCVSAASPPGGSV